MSKAKHQHTGSIVMLWLLAAAYVAASAVTGLAALRARPSVPRG